MLISAVTAFFREKRYRYLTFATLVVLILGVIGYRFLEHWSWLDSIHYAVSIMVTTGTAEIYPKSYWGKVFNIFYMILSVILILLLVNTLHQHFHDSRQSRHSKKRRHRKIIDKKMKSQENT